MRFLLYTLLILLVFVRWFSTRTTFDDGQKLKISSLVTEEPSRFSYYQNISLSGLKVYLPKYPEIDYGDKIVVEGIVEKGELKNPVLVRQDKEKIFLSGFRKNLVNFFKKTLPEPHASLVAGIALGAKTSLGQDLWDKLRLTGTAHVVVASGFNVSLVASFLIGFFLLFLKRRKAVFVAIAGIWVYTLISGFDAPIVRAAVMGTIAFTAQEFGRLYSAWNALVISGLIMLILVPDWVGDLGFILSFVATASLLLFYKKVDKVFSFLPKILREGLTTSIAAQIGVGPILFVTFGSFNLLSPLVNAGVLWTIPYITILGMLGGAIGLLVPILGKAILLMSLPLTTWFLGIINLFS